MKKEIRMKNLMNWRKAFMLSVSFLCAFTLVTSCKKNKNPLGEGALPDGTSISSGAVDTFSLVTYSFVADSVVTQNPRYNLVGAYNDPVFGTVEAQFFTQLSLSAFSNDFGEIDDLIIDSMVLAFRYGGYYGTPNKQLFEVYELAAPLSADSTYYSFSSVPIKSQNLVPTDNDQGSILPKPLKSAVVGSDTVPPQLRIPLDTNFARNLIEIAANSTSNDQFFEAFKGFNIKVNSSMLPPNVGSVLYLESTNPASKLIVYYRQPEDTVSRQFDFLISNPLIDFNKIDTDRNGTPLAQVLEDTISGQRAYYAQAGKVRAKIEFPGVSNLSKDVVIQRAELELPVSYFSGSDLYPSTLVSVGAKFYDDLKDLFLVAPNGVTFSQQRRAYVIDMREHIQKIITGERINDGIVVSPALFNTTTERIVFNGSETLNKSKPKLRIVFSEF
jgi:hypothetical protein